MTTLEMPRFYTRKRGKQGMSLRNALTYKNQNGIKENIYNDDLTYLGSGSYGSIHSINATNVVFKRHNINPNDNRHTDNKCLEWEHEYNIQKKVFAACNNDLKNYYICIAKPYAFHYMKKMDNGLHKTKNVREASACIFTMDRILDGSKWDKHLKSPHKKTLIPSYILFGTLETTLNRITLESLKQSVIYEMPNEAYSFCLDPGTFGMQMQESMAHAFFVLLEKGFMPRDIEYVMDGRKYTQTLIAIIDFNEVKTIQERAESYGEGYDVTLDTAHVYIDLCGLRTGNVPNPMAPYDSPTPQWKFLCNPLICPLTFLTIMQPYRDVGEIILKYTYTKKMKTLLDQANIEWWKPLYVSKNPVNPNQSDLIGTFTETEYQMYRKSQCIFYAHNHISVNENEQNVYYVTHNKNESYCFDEFVEFDIQFQHYILALLVQSKKHPNLELDFQDILQNVGSAAIPQVEEWNEMSLF
jgi:hypothetical protein